MKHAAWPVLLPLVIACSDDDPSGIGTYSQVGRMGTVNGGSYNCTIGGQANAIAGNFTITELANSRNGINGRIAGTTQFCSYGGFFGGVKDVF